MSHMHRNARSHHTMSQETSKQSPFSLLFHLIMSSLLLLKTHYARITIELDPIFKWYCGPDNITPTLLKLSAEYKIHM